MPSPAASFAEIRAVAASLPLSAVALRDAIAHPRIVLYAATHGVAAGLAGGSSQAMTAMVDRMVAGRGPLHDLVARADGDLRLYDLALDHTTRDPHLAPAMDEREACRAAAYGMMAVEPGIDIFVVAALGVGAELAGSALARALMAADRDPLELLAALGGPDIAAILGLILASRLAGVPVILDGIAAYAAATVAKALRADALARCRMAASQVAGFTAAGLGLESVLPGPSDSPLSGARALIEAMS